MGIRANAENLEPESQLHDRHLYQDYFFNDFDGYNVTRDKVGASAAFRQDRVTLGAAFSF